MKFYYIAKVIAKIVSFIFFPVKIHGDIDKMPSDGGIMVCANHVSFLDVVFLGISCKRQIHFVGKNKYAENPFLKPLFLSLGAFGINPDKPDLKSIKKCFKTLNDNEILGIFPEGTRIRNGKISDPMPGAIMIAHKTKKPIFYYRIKPRKGEFKLFIKTDVYAGDLITAEQLGVTDGKGDEYKTASENLMKKIYGLGE